MVEMVKATLNGSYTITIPKHRAERPEWYTTDGWEKKRLRALKQAIERQKKPVVYYVGAEEGEMPALCQLWGAKVALFEPNPKVWPNIKAIWEANNLEFPLMLFEGFASNQSTQNVLDNLHQYSWMNNAEDEVIGNHGFKELYLEADNYPQVRIDDLLGMGINLEPPTIISMDVEGSEYEVLKGAEQTIKRYRPDIFLSLHPEFLFHQWGVYGTEVRGWIKEMGYSETLIDYQHEVHLLYEHTSH